MAIADDTLKVHRGDTYTFEITVTTWDGGAFNLTNFGAIFTALIIDEDPSIVVTLVSIPNPLLGKVEITLESNDTQVEPKQYDYDVEIRDNSNPAIVHTIADGKIIILIDKTVPSS
jgi:hypothetical protein